MNKPSSAVSLVGALRSEDPLLVFVSSAQTEFAQERQACVEAVQSLVLTRPWAFEYASASADSADASYLKKVDECDIFVLLVGRDLPRPVRQEWERALSNGKRRLVFLKEGRREPPAEAWVRRLDVKYGRFSSSLDLREQLVRALVDELIKGYREFRLRDSDYDALATGLKSVQVGFSVRTISASDLTDLPVSLPNLVELYPTVHDWLGQKRVELAHGQAEGLVATYGVETAGLAITSNKEPGVRKVSTLAILPRFQGLGVGARLLYEVIAKAVRDGVEKLYLTVSDERALELEGLLERYGFYLEGISAGRYRSGSFESVWSKRLIHGLLLTKDLKRFVRRYLFRERGFDIRDLDESSFVATERTGALGRSVGPRPAYLVSVATTDEEQTLDLMRKKAMSVGLPLIFVGLNVPTEANNQEIFIDATDLEIGFFPLFVQRHIGGLIVPIQERFACNLIPDTQRLPLLPPDKVQLRTDNVYYRYPNMYHDLMKGAALFFYETERHGASRLLGEAKLLEWSVDEPRELFAKFGSIGVYSLDSVSDLVAPRGADKGKALAIKFDWYREADRKLTYREVKKVFDSYDPTTARRLDDETILELRRAVGWNVRPLSFQSDQSLQHSSYPV